MSAPAFSWGAFALANIQKPFLLVIPAQAGIQWLWLSAFANA
jgi:hypothetical protein